MEEYYVNRGIDFLYNYQFKESKIALDSVLIINPLNPVSPFLLIIINWLDNQTKNNYEQSYNAINVGIKKTIPHYKTLVNRFPDNAEYRLYLGCTFGIKARIALANKDWFSVLYSGYKGISIIRQARMIDPKLYDAIMPIGLVDYYSCISSPTIQWLSTLMGITPDCDLGIKKLEIVVDQSKYAWIESANILTYIYLYFEKDYERSLEMISPLVIEFPGHPFFQFLKAESLGRLGRWNEVEIMKPTLKKFTINGPFLLRNECELKLMHLDALYHFQSSNYLKVIEISNWIIDNYNMEFDWLLGFAHLLRGKSFDLLDQREKAIYDYRLVASLDNKFPEIIEAKELLTSPFKLNVE